MLKQAAHPSLQFLVMYKKPVLKCCLLTTNTQKRAVRRSSVTCWVVRDTKVTAVAVGGPGLEFVWLQVFPLDYNDLFPLEGNCTGQAPLPHLRLLEPPESCEGVSGGNIPWGRSQPRCVGQNGNAGP